jgi:hypothetical protein
VADIKYGIDINMLDQDILNALTGIVFQNAPVLPTDSIRTAIGKLAGSNAAGLSHIDVTSSIAFITTSLTDTVIAGMTATPEAGTYLALYSGDNLLSANNSICTTSIYKNDVAIPDSIRNIQASGGGWKGTASSMTTVQVNGTDTVDIRTKITSGQITVSGRLIILLRIGA